GQPSEDLDEKLIQKTKLRIGEAADSLFSLITRHTPTTTEKTLRKLRGNTLTGEEASSLGIISGTVPTLDSLYTIININKEESSMKPTPTPTAGVAVPAVAALPKIPSATAVPVVPTAAATLDSPAPTDEIQAAVNTERLRSSKILQAGTTFGIRAEAIQQMIDSGATAEAATTSFQFIASEVSALAGIPMGAAISTQPVAEQADTTDRTASPDALFGVEA
ncbi:MAG: hypothetical protein KAG66_12325, partial [Methylococcales bacterium]|nr:hypothetical protein [Methylococcales bacterium]